MVADIITNELVEERNEHIDKMLGNFSSLDGNMESGIEILSVNQEVIEKIKDINEKLSILNNENNEEYINKLNLVIIEQKKVMLSIKKEQKLLLGNLNQLSKKNQIVKSYISVKHEPIFIDKDVL